MKFHLFIAALICLAQANTSAAEVDGLSIRLDLPANYILYDSMRNRILASVGSPENSIINVDPVTGAQEPVLHLPFNPGLIALSDDGHFLYVAESSSEHIYRIDLATASLDSGFKITPDVSDRPIISVVSAPNEPQVVVIAGQESTTAFDNAVPREAAIHDVSQISRGEEPSVFYQSTLNYIGPPELRRLELRADGLHTVNETIVPGEAGATGFSINGSWVLYSSGYLYDGKAGVLIGRADPGAQRVAGQMPVLGPGLADQANSRLLFLTSPGQPFVFPETVLRSFSSETFKESWSVVISGIDQFPLQLIHTSPGHAAFTVRPACESCSSLYLTLLNLNAVPAAPTADLHVALTLAKTNVMVGRTVTLDCGIGNDGPWTATGIDFECRYPSGLRFEYVANAGSATNVVATNGIIHGQLPDLPNREGTHLQFVFTVVSDGDQVITANVNHREEDAVPGNNASTATLEGAAVPTITFHDGSVTEGETQYSGPLITLSNPVPEIIPYLLVAHSGTATTFEDGWPGAFDLRTFISATFIPAGKTSVVASFLLLDDTVAEPPETLTLELQVATNFVVIHPEATLTIYDNDFPTVSVASNQQKEGPLGQTNHINFEISYTPRLDSAVAVSYHTVPQSALPNVDYIPVQGRLEFPPGVSSLSVAVPILGNDQAESDRSFLLVLDDPAGLILSADPSGRGLIVDDDAPPPLQITGIKLNSDLVTITFENVPGLRYQLQWKPNLTEPWGDSGEPVTSFAGSTTVNHVIVSKESGGNGFFRIVTLP
jgi:hypothetical protein